ncbi:MAG: sigma-B regulation protein RsbU (phosphoserine phosphatase) [Candidatus Latescibacterota bacterium]
MTRRMKELQALCDIGATITSVLDSKLVIQKILSGIVDTLGFDRAYLMTVDENDHMLRNAGSYGVSGDALTFLNQLEYDLKRDDVGVVLTVKENRPILVEDVDNTQIQLDNEAIQMVGFRSFVTAPLRAGSRRIGVMVADRSGAGERVTEHDQRLLVGFANQAAIALENARLYEEATEKKRLEEEVGVAAEIQKRLLPATLPTLEGYEISAMTRPSRGVSGDYYDVVEMPDGRVWIAVGDVCGKGIPAALTMATLRTLFRTQVEHNLVPADMMKRVADGLFQATSPEVFATFCFGVLDLAGRTFTYVNAGHPFPILARASGETVELDGVGLPVGMDPMLWQDEYEARQVDLASGDVLVILSDGIPEAGAGHEDMFGEDRVFEVVTNYREHGALRVQKAVCDAVDAFMKGQPMDDDLTLVALGVK